MDTDWTVVEVFKCKVGSMYSLYEELDSSDRSIALESLKDLIQKCDSKLNNRYGPVLPDTDAIVQLQLELDQLRKENAKLQDELEKLSTQISNLPTLQQPSDIDDFGNAGHVITNIIQDILQKVVPPDIPVRRRPGRPRKKACSLEPCKTTPAQGLVKGKRGRPRKYPLREGSLSLNTPMVCTTWSKQKFAEVEETNLDENHDNVILTLNDARRKCAGREHINEVEGTADTTRGEVVFKKEITPTVRSARLEKRWAQCKSNRMFANDSEDSHESTDYVNGGGHDDDDDDDSDADFVVTAREKRREKKKQPHPPIPTGTTRKRGRPRKHPIRDPSTIKKHKKIVRHVCKLCDAQFLHGRPFHRHLSERHDNGRTTCRNCRNEFENYAHYLHHKCAASRDGGLACRHCAERFRGARKMQAHMQVAHGAAAGKPLYLCKYCKKGFARKRGLIHHLATHADGRRVCDKCGEFSRDEEAHAAHMATHGPSPSGLRCKRCGAVFDRRQQFEQHLAAHKKYDCTICERAFSQKKLLLRHVRNSHGIMVTIEEKKHTCTECGHSFNRPGQLEVHMRVHTGEQPIQCSTCKVFFKCTKALWKHCQTRSHKQREAPISFAKDHLCATCGKSFYRKQALQRHMRCHCDTEPFGCPHCSYQSQDGNNVKRHIQLHFSARQFVCEICAASFHAKKTLDTHRMYKHSTERHYKCTVCPLTFKTSNSLNRHKVIHCTIRPYMCQSCMMGFNRLYNLRRHMKRVHGNDDILPHVNTRVKILDLEQEVPLKPPEAEVKLSERKTVSHAEFFSKYIEGPKAVMQLKQEAGQKSLAASPLLPPLSLPPQELPQLVAVTEIGGELSVPAEVTTSMSTMPEVLIIPQVVAPHSTPPHIFYVSTGYPMVTHAGDPGLHLQQPANTATTQSLNLANPLSLENSLHIPAPPLSTSQGSGAGSFPAVTMPTMVPNTSLSTSSSPSPPSLCQQPILGQQLQQFQQHDGQGFEQDKQAPQQLALAGVATPHQGAAEAHISYPPDLLKVAWSDEI